MCLPKYPDWLRKPAGNPEAEDIRPYLDVAFECFGPKPLDDRSRLAGLHRSGFVNTGGKTREGLHRNIRNGRSRSRLEATPLSSGDEALIE